MSDFSLLLLIGPAGSGISTACEILTEYGLMVTTGLPAHHPESLIQSVRALVQNHVPMAITLRIEASLEEQNLVESIQALKQAFPDLRILMLDAPENVLIARYMHTGKQHLFEGIKARPSGATSSESRGLQAAIEAEKKLVKSIYALKDYAIDTSNTTTMELRLKIAKILNRPVEKQPLTVYITTFGFKYGMPQDAELVFDMRFITNPFYDEALRPLNGTDRAIREYIFSIPHARDFFDRWSALVGDMLPFYQEQGKTRLTIAVGCTGGKHRSVCMAEALAADLIKRYPAFQIVVTHREMRRWDASHAI